MSKDINIVQTIANLSSLRFFEGSNEEFWQDYLENMALLTKSPLAIIIDINNENLFIEHEYKENLLSEDIKDNILKQSIDIVNKTLSKTYSYEKFRDQEKQFFNYYIVAISLESIDKTNKQSLVLLIENIDKKEFSNAILRATLCRDIVLSQQLFCTDIEEELREESSSNIETTNYFEEVLLLLNGIIHEKKFKLAATNIVDDFANKFNCNKVSIGWEKNDYIQTVAINQVEHFQKSSNKIKSLEAIFEESFEQDEEIYYPEDTNSVLITYAHKIYHRENKLSSLYTFPIRIDDDIIGVISFENIEKILSKDELAHIRLSINYIAPTLYKIYQDDKNIFQKTICKIKKISSDILTPKNSLKKIIVIFSSMVLLSLIFGKIMYKVEAVVNIQTDNILYLSAPFDGIITDVKIDSGDVVKKYQELIIFDIQELSLRKLEIDSDIIKYDTEIEKARSNRALADMKISQAKKEQSIASLKKIDYYLNKAVVKAPFDGIIIDGEKEKLLGSPFSKGDIILQIANPTQLYANVKVLEEYIDDIKVGQIATLNLLSRPSIYFKVKVKKIIPMANVDDVNGNIFTIKVVFLDNVENWVRPGMSGIVKIEIEDKSILWILTHKISDYLYMNLWW